MTCACPFVDQEGSCPVDDDVPRNVYENDRVTIPTSTAVIPTVEYNQRYIKKIVCLSYPSFCDNE